MPSFIQCVSNDNQELSIRIIASGETFNAICRCAAACERGELYISPPRNSRSVHVGAVGEQLQMKLDCYDVGVWLSPQYGLQYIYRFTDGKNEYTWMTKVKLPLGRYTVSAKIKAHQIYNNAATTVLYYLKAEPVR